MNHFFFGTVKISFTLISCFKTYFSIERRKTLYKTQAVERTDRLQKKFNWNIVGNRGEKKSHLFINYIKPKDEYGNALGVWIIFDVFFIWTCLCYEHKK